MTRDDATADAEVAARSTGADVAPTRAAGAAHDLEWHRAETERLRVLVEFLSRPIHAPGGAEPDPDVLTAYNLAVEAALVSVRRAAAPAVGPRPASAPNPNPNPAPAP